MSRPTNWQRWAEGALGQPIIDYETIARMTAKSHLRKPRLATATGERKRMATAHKAVTGYKIQLFGARERTIRVGQKRQALRTVRMAVAVGAIRRGTVWAQIQGKRWHRLASISPDLKGELGVRVTWHRPEMAVSF